MQKEVDIDKPDPRPGNQVQDEIQEDEPDTDERQHAGPSGQEIIAAFE